MHRAGLHGPEDSLVGVQLDELIRTRRTQKAYEPVPVDRDTLDELFELARWAPNHHLTNPWRFRVLGPRALEAIHESLTAAVPGDSPQIVLLASAFDAKTLATVDWLSRRHGLEISCYVLSVFRFGNERLLSIRREYPARDAAAPDPAAEVQRLLTGEVADGAAEPAANGHSTPPPAA